jgi:hypothetical protein
MGTPVARLETAFRGWTTDSLREFHAGYNASRTDLIREILDIAPETSSKLLAGAGVERLVEVLCCLSESHCIDDSELHHFAELA